MKVKFSTIFKKMTKVKINSVVTNKVSKRKNAPLVKGKVIEFSYWISPNSIFYRRAKIKTSKGLRFCLVKNLTVVK